MSKGQREMTYEELKYAYMKKVQRVHELEDAVESYKMAEEQNKRYREALEKIRKEETVTTALSKGQVAYTISGLIANEALEGEK